jgi:hypothetical protein
MRTGTGMIAGRCILIRIRTRTAIEGYRMIRRGYGAGVTSDRLLIICCSVTE